MQNSTTAAVLLQDILRSLLAELANLVASRKLLGAAAHGCLHVDVDVDVVVVVVVVVGRCCLFGCRVFVQHDANVPLARHNG